MEEKMNCGFECGKGGCTRPAGTDCTIDAACSCSDCEEMCVETTLVSDIRVAVENQKERDAAEKGEYTASNFESYALLLKVLEDKDSVSKSLDKNVKCVWDGIKSGNEDVVMAHFRQIGNIAEEVARCWVAIAALCEKAEETARAIG
ncbi:MAG: hypothetical protein IJY96_05070 [Oscillospiraceae bacterium]|nr:hypothetical protein [Oscillospiraceae bacterium]